MGAISGIPNQLHRLIVRVRRSCRYVCLVAMFGLGLVAPSRGQPGPLYNEETRQVVAKGLRYLAQRQSEDGAFGTGYGQNVGVCGIAGLAFLSSGSTPGRGPYGQNLNKCVDYLLSRTQENGFIHFAGGSSHGPMYGHGFATLFLSEVYGMSPREDLRDKLSRAVKLIVDTQNDDGGWRYQPKKSDADISVTICQIMALRAAKNSGIFVPKQTVDRCVEYVKRSQNSDGGFMYTLDGSGSEFPRSAAGVVALYSAGIYRGDELSKGIAYLKQFRPGQNLQQEAHFFYGQYYAAQAMWQAGDDAWNAWYPAIRDKLIARQAANGSWVSAISPEYGTAMATIILQIPNDCLPIFQR